MVGRENFDAELKKLREKLLELGSMAESAIDKSLKALEDKNVDQALEVIDEDIHVDRLEEEINDLAILMIAKQQPVATDLRRIIVAIKISSDVERMADYAVNIAKSTIRIGDKQLVKPLEHIPEMAGIAQDMIAMSLKAYNDEDVVVAKELAEMDDRVDELYGIIIQELLSLTSKQPEAMAQITQLSFIARYLERTADHATNIGENILYLVKGRRYDLNE